MAIAGWTPTLFSVSDWSPHGPRPTPDVQRSSRSFPVLADLGFWSPDVPSLREQDRHRRRGTIWLVRGGGAPPTRPAVPQLRRPHADLAVEHAGHDHGLTSSSGSCPRWRTPKVVRLDFEASAPDLDFIGPGLGLPPRAWSRASLCGPAGRPPPVNSPMHAGARPGRRRARRWWGDPATAGRRRLGHAGTPPGPAPARTPARPRAQRTPASP